MTKDDFVHLVYKVKNSGYKIFIKSLPVNSDKDFIDIQNGEFKGVKLSNVLSVTVDGETKEIFAG